MYSVVIECIGVEDGEVLSRKEVKMRDRIRTKNSDRIIIPQYSRGEDPEKVPRNSKRYLMPVRYAEYLLHIVRKKPTIMPISGEQKLVDDLGISEDNKYADSPPPINRSSRKSLRREVA